MRVEAFSTDVAPAGLLADLRAVCVRAFDGEFTAEDWSHALGGRHFVAFAGEVAVAHAAVVARTLEVDGRSFEAGYVEAVATDPERQRQGFGTEVMAEAGGWIRTAFELGALATGTPGFYRRLGWERWQGRSYVRDGEGVRRSEEDDDAIMVFRFGASARIELGGSIVCPARRGDDW